MSSLIYDITSNCNLACKHCYNSKFLKGSEETLINVNEVISKILEIKPEVLLIQGGEPLLVKNLEQLIERVKREKIKAYITTNAISFDENRIINILRTGISGIFFSLESNDEKKNDLIRGQGSYKTAIFNIKNFIKIYNLALNKNIINEILICLYVTITPLNINNKNDIENIFKLASNLGLKDLSFAFLIPSGVGEELIKLKNSNSNIDIADFIAEVSQNYPNIRVRIPYKKLLFEYLNLKFKNLNIWGEKSKCIAGEKLNYLNKDLEIHPCSCVNKYDLNQLFIKKNQIKKNQKYDKKYFKNFYEVKGSNFRKLPNLCKNCQHLEECIKVCPYDLIISNEKIDISECIELKKRINNLVE
ncbi:radical SAM protein [Psychrilyobacter sp.]|uniref:radical SAM protein n=1 Tax=Psychrilyobacter sp. TaxID=2586924 RepID=UPI00301B3097